MAENIRKMKIHRLRALVPQLKHESNMQYRHKINKILEYLEDEDFFESVKDLYGFEEGYRFKLLRDAKSADKNYINDSLMIIKARELYHEKSNKGFLKHLKRFFIVTGTAILASAFVYGAGVGLTKAYAATAKLDIDQVEYYQNPNVEPGYYNEHPIKVCISDQFNWIFRNGIEKGIKSFDDAAVGIKFEIRCGDLEKLKSEYDISFVPMAESRTSNGNSVLGYTYLSTLEAEKIQGPIFLDQNNIHLFGVKATTMHELGHIFGLEHTSDPNSLMFPVCANYNLSQSDINNINTIYPAAGTVKVETPDSSPNESIPESPDENNNEIIETDTLTQSLDKINEAALPPEEYER